MTNQELTVATTVRIGTISSVTAAKTLRALFAAASINIPIQPMKCVQVELTPAADVQYADCISHQWVTLASGTTKKICSIDVLDMIQLKDAGDVVVEAYFA